MRCTRCAETAHVAYREVHPCGDGRAAVQIRYVCQCCHLQTVTPCGVIPLDPPRRGAGGRPPMSDEERTFRGRNRRTYRAQVQA